MPNPLPPPTSSLTAGTGKAPILIIDDEPDLRDALRLLFEDEGYTVAEAADALTGYNTLLASPTPLVVLLDHKLPVIDGCDLLDLVEHDQRLRRHAFIFMTASDPKTLQGDCADLPEEVCVAVIYKPFDLDEVLATIVVATSRLATEGR